MSNYTNHYVYLLQHRYNGMNYIGVRSCKCLIGADTYMGSSTIMTQEDKDKCTKITLKRFVTRQEAVAYEIELHEKFDVGRNPLFYNKAKQTATGFDTSGKIMDEAERSKRGKIQKERFAKSGHPCIGTKLSEEHKVRIGQGLLGNQHPQETKDRIRAAHRKRAVHHHKFEPWWYEVHGVRTKVYDKTIRDFADEMNVKFDSVKDRFRAKFVGKELTKGPLQGYKFGRIINGS